MEAIELSQRGKCYCGDALGVLRGMESESVNCVVTSPPYWGLRDYGTAKWSGGLEECDHRQEAPRFNGPKQTVAQVSGYASKAESHDRAYCPKCGALRVDSQLGLEKTPAEYVEKMAAVFREVRRVLRADGTLWLNMGDCYATGAGAVGEHPGGGERGARWRGEITRYRDERRRPHGQPKNNGHGLPQVGRVGSNRAQRGDGNERVPFGPMTQPNRMPIEGLKTKDLVGMPWRLAFALQADGWWLRQDIIWSKPNPMPESVTDRCTKSHEYVFLLSKSERYYFNQEAILEPCSPSTHARLSQDVQSQIGSERAHAGGKTNGDMEAVGRTPASYKGIVPGRDGGPGQERRSTNDRRPKAWDVDMGSNWTLVAGQPRKLADPGSGTKNNCSFDSAMAIMPEKRNKRSVWEVTTQPFPEAHFATFPEELIKPCILAGCPAGGTVLDPFFGSGTTGLVASANGCNYIGIELNPGYIEIARRRLRQEVLDF
jgi:DNA modification methylase